MAIRKLINRTIRGFGRARWRYFPTFNLHLSRWLNFVREPVFPFRLGPELHYNYALI
jgi:hypothetical protein